ncbi:histidine utilization repressor [Alteromonas sp. KUL42]|uniref:histidine utilization repressor n=1 Tax=Alteromonas sp. KUL42 TaxID=2480797 RepID=UPI001036EC52|nr:histidine utilization repressor [Alteromonas sp. KUL42]TAP37433.1 histidine utilization repressor [Alteromonas sp. KUL42]GEA05828.1 histidine utilization repressor [Alteromonas sp. KUL42]
MQPRYVQIKTWILNAIEAGDMKPSEQVPSENQLAQQHGVSRMTARRALSEMVDEGILMRTQGIGTFVSDNRPMSSMLEIKSIRDEIEQRGHQYSNEVLLLEKVVVSSDIAHRLAVAEGSEVFHSIIVHCENTLPVQYEDRWVNPEWVPDYLEKDFKAQTANYYLNQVAPLSQADHSVEAVLVCEDIAHALLIQPSAPCLKVTRRTFTRVHAQDIHKNNGVVSHAVLYHPGNRFRLGGHLEF